MMTGTWLALLLLLSLPVAACEYPGVPHPQAAQLTAAPVVTLQHLPAMPQEQGQKTASSDVLVGTVHITLKDFLLVPDRLTVKAGTTKILLKNEGRYTHDFRVQGQGLDTKSSRLGSGRTIEFEVALEPGTYRISCPVSNHDERGMVGTLEVVP